MAKFTASTRRLVMLVVSLLAAGATASYVSLTCECNPMQQSVEYHGAAADQP